MACRDEGFDIVVNLADGLEPSTKKLAIAAIVAGMESQGLVTSLLVLDGITAVGIRAMLAPLELEAEREELRMVTKTKDAISGSQRLEPFTIALRERFSKSGSSRFFLPCDRARMTLQLAQRVGVRTPDCSEPVQKLCRLFPELGSASLHEESVLDALERAGVVNNVTCVHDETTAAQLWAEAAQPWPPGTPVNNIRAYFGSEVAMYFAWLNHLTLWLVGPSVAGLLLYLLRPTGTTADSDVANAFFSIAMVIWGFCFSSSWRRQAADWACRWDTLQEEAVDEPNPRFHGVSRTSPVTGMQELYYDNWKRQLVHYPVSVGITVGMLCVAAGVMCLSLNAQGYVHERSVIYVPTLAHLAAKGGIFDQNELMPSLIPVILHTAVILALNKAYSYVAEWLTDMENHRWRHEREASLVMKRFLFEAFDCYMGPAYIAFYELDIVKLRGELASLYTVDSARRIATECLLPMLLHLWATKGLKPKQSKDASKGLKPKQSKDASTIMSSPSSECDAVEASGTTIAVIEESSREEYESFDDYLEMTIQLGYVCLFAAAFPLAAPLTLVCNLIEMRSDVFKLAYVSRRPHARRANSIGPWQTIVTGIMWLSAVTNVVVMGLTTEQLMVLFPNLFVDQGDEHSAQRGAVALMVGIEHVLLLIGLIIMLAVPMVPEWVKDDQRRRAYEAKQALLANLRDSTHSMAMGTNQAGASKLDTARRSKKAAVSAASGIKSD